METENRVLRSGTVTFDEYMHTAVHSIGIAFVWSTYLVHKKVPLSTIHAIDTVFLLGANVVRLSNDIASHRQGKRTNAVTLLGGAGARKAVSSNSSHKRAAGSASSFKRCTWDPPSNG
jgi:hypothetical protein